VTGVPVTTKTIREYKYLAYHNYKPNKKMKTNTFILIVAAYSTILALPAIFFPDFSLAYFGISPSVPEEHSLVNFVGGYQLLMAYLGYVVYRSTDKEARRGWLLGIALVTLFAICVQQVDLNVRGIKAYPTMYLDEAIWLAIAIGSLYFRGKE
jgi:hypothetical protein